MAGTLACQATYLTQVALYDIEYWDVSYFMIDHIMFYVIQVFKLFFQSLVPPKLGKERENMFDGQLRILNPLKHQAPQLIARSDMM